MREEVTFLKQELKKLKEDPSFNVKLEMGIAIFGHDNELSPRIVDYLLNNENYSSAKEIKKAISKVIGKNVSKTTLFRHLNRLVETNVLITEIFFKTGKTKTGRETRRAISVFIINPNRRKRIEDLIHSSAKKSQKMPK